MDLKALGTARGRTIKVLKKADTGKDRKDSPVEAYIYALSAIDPKVEKTLRVSFAFCNPKDQYSRVNGASITVTRMLHGEFCYVPAGPGCKDRIIDMALSIAKDLDIKWLNGVERNQLV